jgi:hypothetical protein
MGERTVVIEVSASKGVDGRVVVAELDATVVGKMRKSSRSLRCFARAMRSCIRKRLGWGE